MTPPAGQVIVKGLHKLALKRLQVTRHISGSYYTESKIGISKNIFKLVGTRKESWKPKKLSSHAMSKSVISHILQRFPSIQHDYIIKSYLQESRSTVILSYKLLSRFGNRTDSVINLYLSDSSRQRERRATVCNNASNLTLSRALWSTLTSWLFAPPVGRPSGTGEQVAITLNSSSKQVKTTHLLSIFFLLRKSLLFDLFCLYSSLVLLTC